MSRIRILPEVLANQIAAGEVVERPASVVKELVENALDAGSTRILIDIEKGGRSLIRVADNGSGMSRDDALLALERFATSKIRSEADLFSIRTLGFRGEALPSIAAVSKMTLTPREAAVDGGVQIHIDGGRIAQVSEAGAPPGTMIDVARLFFNTPARRKFLKAVETEMGHIADAAAGLALGRPDVQIKLSHNGKSVKHWPRVANPARRAADVLGQAAGADLIGFSAALDDLKIEGHLGPAALARSTARGIYLYVNGRRVRDRIIQHALFDGYGSRLMKGRFPLAVLFVTLPFDQVDVNVHPTKHEIRFADQRRVHDSVRNQVAAALSRAEKRFWSIDRTAGATKAPEASTNVMPPYRIASAHAHVSEPDTGPFVYQSTPEQQPPPAGTYAPAEPPAQAPADGPKPGGPDAAAKTVPAMPLETPGLWDDTGFAKLEVIGQFHGTYIICQATTGLILIDQHAAHERIVYERLKAQPHAIHSQRLLIPETVDLGYAEARALEALIPRLNAMGLEIEPFGGATFAIKSVPTLLDDRAIGRMVRELAEKAVEIGLAGDPEKLLDQCHMVMACHHAVRANQRLAPQQISAMLEQLDRCDDPNHCPHGRPTWIQWRVQDLERLFKRIVS